MRRRPEFGAELLGKRDFSGDAGAIVAALRELRESAGTLYDPAVVDAFAAIIEQESDA